jgi:hypothetical protein
MSAADIRIAEKRGEAEAAREALFDTVEEIKARLAPASIAHDAWEGARDKGVAVAEGAVETVKQRPALGAALVFARKPIINLLAGLFTDRDRKTKGRKSNLKNKE